MIPPESPESGHQPPPSATDAIRLQILATEHWSLLASRSLAWNEAFSRAGMFLSTLSGAVVALALAAQASGFGRTFDLFALAVLPIVVFVGVTTVLRLGEANYHDFKCVAGMNRMRSAYLEMAPELRPYFVMSPYDDVAGIATSQGYRPGGWAITHLITATPAVVGTLTSAVAGVLGAIIGRELANGVGAVLLGLIVFAGVYVTLSMHARRMAVRTWQAHRPQFPSPPPS